jgi:hypothetical protein
MLAVVAVVLTLHQAVQVQVDMAVVELRCRQDHQQITEQQILAVAVALLAIQELVVQVALVLLSYDTQFKEMV